MSDLSVGLPCVYLPSVLRRYGSCANTTLLRCPPLDYSLRCRNLIQAQLIPGTGSPCAITCQRESSSTARGTFTGSCCLTGPLLPGRSDLRASLSSGSWRGGFSPCASWLSTNGNGSRAKERLNRSLSRGLSGHPSARYPKRSARALRQPANSPATNQGNDGGPASVLPTGPGVIGGTTFRVCLPHKRDTGPCPVSYRWSIQRSRHSRGSTHGAGRCSTRRCRPCAKARKLGHRRKGPMRAPEGRTAPIRADAPGERSQPLREALRAF